MKATAQQILALAPNWIGDAVMCTPALRALRHRYPDAQFSVAGREGVCALLSDTPWIDRLIELPEKPSFSRMLAIARKIRPAGRDLVVVFPHSFRAALFARLVGGRQRLGYARNGRAWLLTHACAPHRESGRITPVYMAREYVELVAALGCEDDGTGLELGLSENVLQDVKAQLAADKPVIAIAPGAAFGPSKRWMPEAFAETVNRINAVCPATFLLLTGPGEEAIRDAILERATVEFMPMPRADAGLAALKAVISLVDVLICNDSGPRHIAVAFKRPIVCVMGPTSPKYSEGPYEIGQVLRVPLDCSPCQQPVCPLEHHRCMRDISPEQVAQAALRCLTEAGAVTTVTDTAV